MIDLTTYALLRKQITTAASGVSDVRAEGDELVFVLADGHEVRMSIPATEIRDAVVRDDVLVLTLADDKEVVVDATLTQSGQAADAKATGDAVGKIKDDYTQMASDVGQLKDDMTAKADKAALTRTDRSLDALWKLNQGISYNFETDAAAAYAKQVPSGAKLADVQSVGGKTVVWNQPVQYTNSTTNKNGISITSEGRHISIVVENPTSHNQAYIGTIELISGHKYLTLTNKAVESGIEVYFTGRAGIRSGRYTIETPHESYLGNQKVCVFVGASVANGTYEYDVSIFDLTQLFGSGNEPTDISDSRIAWIEQYASAHPEYNAGELVSIDVESVKYNDAIVAAIPSTVRALPGYGWSAGSVANTIERMESGWKYVQRVGSVDLGTLAYDKGVFDNISYFSTDTIESLIKKPLQYVKANILTKNYETINNGNGVLGLKDKTILVYTNSTIYLRDDSVDTVSSLKAKLSGEMAYFELANPIITDITEAMLDTLEPFDVEGGGTLTFTNAAQLPVPSSVEYIVSLAEVGA